MRNTVMRLVRFSVDRPWTVLLAIGILTALFAIQFPKIIIDTDPENMLREDEPIRVFHVEVKKDFGIEELIVLGDELEGGSHTLQLPLYLHFSTLAIRINQLEHSILYVIFQYFLFIRIFSVTFW